MHSFQIEKNKVSISIKQISDSSPNEPWRYLGSVKESMWSCLNLEFMNNVCQYEALIYCRKYETLGCSTMYYYETTTILHFFIKLNLSQKLLYTQWISNFELYATDICIASKDVFKIQSNIYDQVCFMITVNYFRKKLHRKCLDDVAFQNVVFSLQFSRNFRQYKFGFTKVTKKLTL